METRIDRAIAVSNRSFKNSRIPTTFRLVHSQDSGCPRACYWSNPRVEYMGVPTGVEDEADNARSITNVLKIVANFRDSTTAKAQSRRHWVPVATRQAH